MHPARSRTRYPNWTVWLVVLSLVLLPAAVARAADSGACPDLILDGWNWSRVGSGFSQETCWSVGFPPWVSEWCATYEMAYYENEFGFRNLYNCTLDQWA